MSAPLIREQVTLIGSFHFILFGRAQRPAHPGWGGMGAGAALCLPRRRRDGRGRGAAGEGLNERGPS